MLNNVEIKKIEEWFVDRFFFTDHDNAEGIAEGQLHDEMEIKRADVVEFFSDIQPNDFKAKKFTPDEILIWTTASGVEYDVNFRGYRDNQFGHAVKMAVVVVQNSIIGQIDVCVGHLRRKE
jgi:hypothetical protein